MHLVLYRKIKNSNIIMHFMFNDYLSRNGSFNDSQVLIYMMHFMFNDYLSRNDSFNDSQLLILQEKQKIDWLVAHACMEVCLVPRGEWKVACSDSQTSLVL